MNVLKYRFPYKSRDTVFTIAFLGDWHIGHKTVEWDRLHEVLQWVKDTNAYWVGMGDYCQAIVPSPNERRFDLSEFDINLVAPDNQYAKAEELLKPIADKGLMMLTGNHDDVLRRRHYHDFVDSLAHKLGVPYVGFSGFLRLIFERTKPNWRGKAVSKLDIYCHHGYFSGRTKGGKIKRVTELANIFEADVYAMGHVHEIDHTTVVRLQVDKKDKVKEKVRHFLVTGGFIRGYVEDTGTYIERGMYVPTRIGSIALRYWPGKTSKNVEVVEI